jgi:broad specificity phosphatase PhoE
MRVYWARHGENVANLSETFSHRVFDGDLTDRGRDQAHALGRRLIAAGHRFTLVAVSPLRRAVQTAEIVSGHLGVPIGLELDDLREINVGDLDGKNDPESWRIYRAALAGWLHAELDHRFPGGENCHELAARLRRALGRVADTAGEGPALVVAHGANLRAALPTLAAATPDPGEDLRTGDTTQLEVSLASPEAPAIRLLSWGQAP